MRDQHRSPLEERLELQSSGTESHQRSGGNSGTTGPLFPVEAEPLRNAGPLFAVHDRLLFLFLLFLHHTEFPLTAPRCSSASAVRVEPGVRQVLAGTPRNSRGLTFSQIAGSPSTSKFWQANARCMRNEPSKSSSVPCEEASS